MRCFLGIDVENEIKNRLKGIQNELKDIDVNLKFVEKENLHITLKFLGEIDESRMDEIKEVLSRELKGIKPFKINIHGLGYFGRDSKMRNVWVGIGAGIDEMNKLSSAINSALKEEPDAGFHSHVTLARVKSADNVHILLDYIRRNNNVNLGEMDVDHVKLKQSILTPEGPVYNDISVFSLRDSDA